MLLVLHWLTSIDVFVFVLTYSLLFSFTLANGSGSILNCKVVAPVAHINIVYSFYIPMQ